MTSGQPQLDLQQFFPYQFSILSGQVSDYIALIYKQQYGLTKFEWRVLATVGQHLAISSKSIAAFTQLDKMQVSRAIARLIKIAALEPQNSSQDRRSHLLALTSIGQQMYQEIVPLVIEQEKRMLAGLTQQERQLLSSLTLKLSAQLADQ
jgi:DNA-binding MarR family transcriptional regulator